MSTWPCPYVCEHCGHEVANKQLCLSHELALKHDLLHLIWDIRDCTRDMAFSWLQRLSEALKSWSLSASLEKAFLIPRTCCSAGPSNLHAGLLLPHEPML